MAAQIGQPCVVGQSVFDQFLSDARHHGLTAVRQIPDSRRLVDRGTCVVSFVAHLHITGVHADAQLDRGEVSKLQIERTCHCVAGACKGGHEAVAFALFDRPYAVVLGNDFVSRPVQTGQRGRHRLRLGLPELGRALDVGEQQRHRAGRQQLGHVNVAPVSRAHASQHPPPLVGKTSAQRRIYAPSLPRASTPQGGWSGAAQTG